MINYIKTKIRNIDKRKDVDKNKEDIDKALKEIISLQTEIANAAFVLETSGKLNGEQLKMTNRIFWDAFDAAMKVTKIRLS